MACFTALAGCGGDEDDVASGSLQMDAACGELAWTPARGRVSIWAEAAWTRPKTLSTLMDWVRRHWAEVMLTIGASIGGQMPWLTMSMSRSPKTARV